MIERDRLWRLVDDAKEFGELLFDAKSLVMIDNDPTYLLVKAEAKLAKINENFEAMLKQCE